MAEKLIAQKFTLTRVKSKNQDQKLLLKTIVELRTNVKWLKLQ